MSQIVVCALYKFVHLPQFETLRQPLLDVLNEHQIRGTLLLAAEGINGTVAGTQASIDALRAWLNAQEGLLNIDCKFSYHDQMPFHRTKVKLKKEIVTMGIEGIDPRRVVGTYVQPKDWNALLNEPDVLLIDTRNDYEYAIGTFKNAINPNTESFREFPDYVQQHLDPAKHKKVAMFCTGGIRCEKSTAYLKEQGFDEVYHLQGGILKYLEEVPAPESLWQGECFVFDDRVAVNHSLQKGQYDQCHACRYPITESDKASPKYEYQISCPHCFDTLNDDKKIRLHEREKQMKLAQARGENHIGGDVHAIAAARHDEKKAKREADRLMTKK